MNRTQALAKLKKVLGKKLAYREDPSALIGDDREAAEVKRKLLRDAQHIIRDALEARRVEVLAADAEFQRLSAQYRRTREAADKASGEAYARRIAVGTLIDIAGMGAFSVKAEGDNWQEVVDKLTGSGT